MYGMSFASEDKQLNWWEDRIQLKMLLVLSAADRVFNKQKSSVGTLLLALWDNKSASNIHFKMELIVFKSLKKPNKQVKPNNKQVVSWQNLKIGIKKM